MISLVDISVKSRTGKVTKSAPTLELCTVSVGTVTCNKGKIRMFVTVTVFLNYNYVTCMMVHMDIPVIHPSGIYPRYLMERGCGQ